MKNSSNTLLITGTSSGIGYGCAAEFLKNGYTVFGSVRSLKDADMLSQRFGNKFIPLVFDVTDTDAIANAVQTVDKQLSGSGLCGLINNAGIVTAGPLMDIPMNDVKQQFNVNVFGLLEVTRAFLPLLGARKDHPVKPGKILNISSTSGKIAHPFIGPYVGTKFAVEGISHTLRRELRLFGIDVIIIGPADVITPIWEKGVKPTYKDSPFQNAYERGCQIALRDAQKGLTTEEVGKQIVKIFRKSKPRSRYTLVKGRLKNWTIPYLMPDRMFDKVLDKMIGLTKA